MGDEYIKRLDRVEGELKDAKKRETYRHNRRNYKYGVGHNEIGIKEVKEILASGHPRDKSFYYAGTAHRLMNLNDPLYAFYGALLYEKIGKGAKPFVKNKLLKSIEEHPEKFSDFDKVRDFLKRNSTEKKGGLESKTITMIVSGISFLIGLFFLSPSITGNAIGPLDRSSSTIAGIVFVVLGILGYYFIAKMTDYL